MKIRYPLQVRNHRFGLLCHISLPLVELLLRSPMKAMKLLHFPPVCMEICNERKDSCCGNFCSLWLRMRQLKRWNLTKWKTWKKKKKHGFIASSGLTQKFSFDHISHPDDLTSHLTYCFGEAVWNIQDYFCEILDIGSWYRMHLLKALF